MAQKQLWMFFLKYVQRYFVLFSLYKFWEIQSSNNQVISPSLPHYTLTFSVMLETKLDSF
jgi:hypothetical protein